jgi:hypothetical protein
MIVGGEHMVGANRHHDYDELMELGAEPATSRQRDLPHQVRHETHAPMHPAHLPQHGGHAPPPPREIHHHYGPPPQPEHPHHSSHAQQEQHRPHMEEPRRKRLVAEEPTHERQFPIGFRYENIAPNDEEDIEVKPQVYFRGERLAIPPSIARFFDILDIKVGKDSQLAATGTMPGESFSAHAVGVRMELDTAKPGIVITIRVRNVDTAPHDFKAVLYGAVLE